MKIDELEEIQKRKKWAWEFMRRSDEYIKNYKMDEKKKELSEGKCRQNYFHWRFWGKLPDPKEPNLNSVFNKLHFTSGDHTPISSIGMFRDFVQEHPVWLYRPGERIGEAENRIFKYWVVRDHKKNKYEKLNSKNIPSSFVIEIKVDPKLQKNRIRKDVMEVVEEFWNLILEAQKSITKDKSLTSFKPRWDNYQKYIQVYDLKKTNPKIEWSEIAKIVIPEEVYENPNKRAKKKTLVSQSTIDKVRYYWREANKMINEGGWRQI